MNKRITILSALAICVVSVNAQTILLDNFNLGTATGAVVGGTSWVGQVTPNATTITVGGTAGDQNGWAATGQNIDASAMNWVAITAQVDSGNVAASVAVRFTDASLVSEIVNVSMISFTSSLTTVYIPVAWTSGIDNSAITSWSIGGGNVGSSTFHMTFDNLALTTAVPEPATYAVIFGALALGFVAYRRRQVA